ncbi:hypothetical protein BGZ65_010494 [Modicella reniformis]|uniref:Uncharacterized protein n=1 Tax=Modicella reniformis TaxID=1440133 RepID=A0A9P6SRP6_9FUNG|nr:hypothetical protein BGZ65_010494 [Modicella reniformis]
MSSLPSTRKYLFLQLMATKFFPSTEFDWIQVGLQRLKTFTSKEHKDRHFEGLHSDGIDRTITKRFMELNFVLRNQDQQDQQHLSEASVVSH